MITFDLFEGEDRDRIRDTVTKAAIIKARAKHPSATSDIEALAQDMIDTQKHDEQELKQAQEINVRQDELLKQIRALDRRQDSEIDQVEDEENSLEQKIELLRAANEKLAQTVANMRSRKKNAEVKLDESGPEIWTVHFTDGSTAKIRVPSDETDPALVRKHFAKQGRTVAKFDYGFGHEPAAGPGPEAHEPGSGTAVSARTGEPLPEAHTVHEENVEEGLFFKGEEERAVLNSITQKIINPFKEYARNQLIDKDEFGYPTVNAVSLFMSLNLDDLIDKFIINFLIKEYGNVKARELYKKYHNELHVNLEEQLMIELKNIKQQFKDVAEAVTIPNRAGYNPIRGKSDYADKRAHLFDLLSHSGMAPEDKQVIRQRLLDLDTEARKQGLIK